MGANRTEVQNKPQTDGVSNIEEEQSMSPKGEVVGKHPPPPHTPKQHGSTMEEWSIKVLQIASQHCWANKN